MGVTQTNRFECERCGIVVTQTDEVSQYDDPVVILFGDVKWDYLTIGDKQDIFCCPRCVDWWQRHGKELEITGKLNVKPI